MRKFSKVFESSADQQIIEDVVSGLEMCKFINEVSVQKGFDNGYIYSVEISFSKECMSQRKFDDGYSISVGEMNDYWQEIIDATNTLESYGFVCRISYYAANGIQMIMKVYKETIGNM